MSEFAGILGRCAVVVAVAALLSSDNPRSWFGAVCVALALVAWEAGSIRHATDYQNKVLFARESTA